MIYRQKTVRYLNSSSEEIVLVLIDVGTAKYKKRPLHKHDINPLSVQHERMSSNMHLVKTFLP